MLSCGSWRYWAITHGHASLRHIVVLGYGAGLSLAVAVAYGRAWLWRMVILGCGDLLSLWRMSYDVLPCQAMICGHAVVRLNGCRFSHAHGMCIPMFQYRTRTQTPAGSLVCAATLLNFEASTALRAELGVRSPICKGRLHCRDRTKGLSGLVCNSEYGLHGTH